MASQAIHGNTFTRQCIGHAVFVANQSGLFESPG
jgi:hypothetical protein